jgi:hypothetical protein
MFLKCSLNGGLVQVLCSVLRAVVSEAATLVCPHLVRQWLRSSMPHPVVHKPELRDEAKRLLDYCLEDIIDDDPDSVLQLGAELRVSGFRASDCFWGSWFELKGLRFMVRAVNSKTLKPY